MIKISAKLLAKIDLRNRLLVPQIYPNLLRKAYSLFAILVILLERKDKKPTKACKSLYADRVPTG